MLCSKFGLLTGTFAASIATWPLLAQLNPSTTAGKLAHESAQGVLAIVVVAEALALILLYRQAREDARADRADKKEQHENLCDLISRNTAIIEQSKDSGHRHSEAIDKLVSGVDKLGGIIDKQNREKER